LRDGLNLRLDTPVLGNEGDGAADHGIVVVGTIGPRLREQIG
jgi:hypothetical protein